MFYIYHDSGISAQENVFSYWLMAFDVHKHFFNRATYFTLKIRTRLISYCNFFLNEHLKVRKNLIIFIELNRKKESRMSCRFKLYEPHFLFHLLNQRGVILIQWED